MQSAANSQPDVQPFLSEARRPTAKRRRTMKSSKVSNIVLVRGGFVDGSGWESVYAILKNKGFNVSIVQNPTISLADDVVVTNRTINAQDGPVVLVGRSYGGAVITEAGNNPKVAAHTAFALDNGESVGTLIKDPMPGAPVPPIMPPQDGFLLLDPTKFVDSFAADVEPGLAAFMGASQVPWELDALNGAVTNASWKSKPSWYLVATDDRMIPPDTQRFMAKRAGATVAEAKGSHAIYVSQPAVVPTSSHKLRRANDKSAAPSWVVIRAGAGRNRAAASPCVPPHS
jgi:pimeloyl-ACP methyl ester carboxylesterase